MAAKIEISDELIAKAFNAYIQAEDNDMLVEFRAGIEAIASELVAQGMERAAEIADVNAKTLEDMMGIYPGDITGEISEEAGMWRELATAIHSAAKEL